MRENITYPESLYKPDKDMIRHDDGEEQIYKEKEEKAENFLNEEEFQEEMVKALRQMHDDMHQISAKLDNRIKSTQQILYQIQKERKKSAFWKNLFGFLAAMAFGLIIASFIVSQLENFF